MKIIAVLCGAGVVVVLIALACAVIALGKCPDADHRWY